MGKEDKQIYYWDIATQVGLRLEHPPRTPYETYGERLKRTAQQAIADICIPAYLAALGQDNVTGESVMRVVERYQERLRANPDSTEYFITTTINAIKGVKLTENQLQESGVDPIAIRAIALLDPTVFGPK